MSKHLPLDLGDCGACDQGTVHQKHENTDGGVIKYVSANCARCHGTGKDRVVQLVSDGLRLLALTANGLMFEQVRGATASEWNTYSWKKVP